MCAHHSGSFQRATHGLPGAYGNIKVISGTGCPTLAAEVSDYLSQRSEQPIPLHPIEFRKFENDNIYVQLGDSVRGQDVYLVQTMRRPVNEMIMELLITLDAIRRDSAGRITVVVPYMAYTRSDKKDEPRTPITARLVADMIQTAGADRYAVIDLHALQIQGFFHIPGDVLTAFYLLKNYVKQNVPLENLTVCTVDLGFAKGGRNWSRALGVPLAFIEKKRDGASVEALSLVGSVEDRDVLIVDDEIDTAGSVVKAVQAVKANGARDVYVAFTHAVFSGPAYHRLDELQGEVKKMIFTNTLPIAPEEMLPNMVILSVGNLLGEVIYRVHHGLSVGKMYEYLYNVTTAELRKTGGI